MITSASTIGLYGKLPAHGDFVERNLARGFIDVWDDWLQRALANSQDSAGDNWLDFYLTAPVWHFALGHGVIDANAWVGIVLPSVDSVGRYFPFTLVQKAGSQTDPFTLMAQEHRRFNQLADLVIDALQNGHSIDRLKESVDALPSMPLVCDPTTRYIEESGLILSQSHDEDPKSSMATLTYAQARMALPSASLWFSRGSEGNRSTCFTAPGLPPASLYWAMISNNWNCD